MCILKPEFDFDTWSHKGHSNFYIVTARYLTTPKGFTNRVVCSDVEELERVVIDEAVLPTNMPLHQESYEHFMLDSEKVCEANQNFTTPETHPPSNRSTTGSLTRSPSITSLTITTSTKEEVGKRSKGTKKKNVSQEKNLPPPIPHGISQWLIDVLVGQHSNERGVLDDFLDGLGFVLLDKDSTDIPSKAQGLDSSKCQLSNMLTPPESQNVLFQSLGYTGVNAVNEGVWVASPNKRIHEDNNEAPPQCAEDNLDGGKLQKTVEHVPIRNFKKACGDCKERLAAVKTVPDGCPPGPRDHQGLPVKTGINDSRDNEYKAEHNAPGCTPLTNVTPPPSSPDPTSSCCARNVHEWSVVEVDLDEAISTNRKTKLSNFRLNRKTRGLNLNAPPQRFVCDLHVVYM
ncbi:unnamed protein product [Lepeophtheirus salmonis]|uniref:(salmon louse) hypothetical protein n=1 Tax=Lepeophtheirus salmonis TaxID=72036 RepID=A0A7R8HDY2_LEPSM|nr:unnamed protein product [Lepeophtheirus salmonis]CAF3031692.1 unnamed protein product [Lepeophtheirus salmonis]